MDVGAAAKPATRPLKTPPVQLPKLTWVLSKQVIMNDETGLATSLNRQINSGRYFLLLDWVYMQGPKPVRPLHRLNVLTQQYLNSSEILGSR